jgi:hypothetical protein
MTMLYFEKNEKEIYEWIITRTNSQFIMLASSGVFN